jgi:hypothetical protein
MLLGRESLASSTLRASAISFAGQQELVIPAPSVLWGIDFGG